MKIDITLKVTLEMVEDAKKIENKALVGHLGTHFDVMNKEFPLTYTERKAVVFDVSEVKNRDIDVSVIDLDKVSADMFVAFYTGFIEEEPYGSSRYFKEHPQLSKELIGALLEKNVSVIGLDFAGVRRTPEHIPTDQYCADRGVFIIENLCHLKEVLDAKGEAIAHIYPLPFTDMTGLPCRVVVEL